MERLGNLLVEDGYPHVWMSPRATLIGQPAFREAVELPVQWHNGGFDELIDTASRLAEYAGRICYMSQDNPAEKSTEDYIGNILEQGHGSVLEHANFTFLVQGISRSLTHEWVRHRAGFAYSQLSQRYVAAKHLAFVMPVEYTYMDEEVWAYELGYYQSIRERFIADIEWLEAQFGDKSSRARRKRVMQTARAKLPNCTETKLVVTANVRAWRHFLALRGSQGAEPEIRRVAATIMNELYQASPHQFSDYTLNVWDAEEADGYPYYITTPYPKV